jgi:hypothetical protein
MMTNATSYDVLVGDIVLYLMGFVLDFWEEIISYKPRWQSTDGHQFQLHVQYFSQGVELVGGVTMLVGFANTLPCGLGLLKGNLDACDVPPPFENMM